jgi:hypothetical protein
MNSRLMKKIVSFVILVLIVLIGSFIYWKYFFNYSDGYRAGLLQKFSRKGNVFKTYEGEMILSSVRSSNNMAISSEKFFFSVLKKEVAVKLEQSQGDYIVVHYIEKNGTLPWRGETTYLVDSVRIANPADALPPGQH